MSEMKVKTNLQAAGFRLCQRRRKGPRRIAQLGCSRDFRNAPVGAEGGNPARRRGSRVTAETCLQSSRAWESLEKFRDRVFLLLLEVTSPGLADLSLRLFWTVSRPSCAPSAYINLTHWLLPPTSTSCRCVDRYISTGYVSAREMPFPAPSGPP